MRTRLLAAALAGTLSIALAGCGDGDGGSGAADDPIKLKFSTFVNETTVPGQTFNWWADEVEKRSDGRVEIERYFDGSLVPAADTLGALADGRVDLAPATEIYSPAELPLSQVAGVPFTTSDPEAMIRAFGDMYAENDDFKEQYERAGAHVLFFLPIGTSTISAADEINSVDDLDGMKIRAGGQAAVALQAVGAAPQSIEIPEVYDAIQRGTIDGISGLPLDTLVGTGLQEVAPHVLSDGLGGFASSAQSISINSWNALPEDVKQIMNEVSDEAVDEGIRILMEANEEACADLSETKDAAVTAMPEDQVETWKSELGDEVVDSWKDSASKAGYDSGQVDDFYSDYTAKIDEYDGQGSYDPASALCG